jgi:hypothetical protein
MIMREHAKSLTKISNAFETRSANVFWQKCETLFDSIYEPIDFSSVDMGIVNKLYNINRLAGYDKGSHEAILRRLSKLASSIDTYSLGYIESDILCWLLRDTTVRTLNIVGTRGVGKSALIHYLFRGIWGNCRELHDYLPLIVDMRNMRAYEEHMPSMDAIRGSVASLYSSMLMLPDQCSATLDVLDKHVCSDEHDNACTYIKSIYDAVNKYNKTVVLILDNLEHLPSYDIAKSLSLLRTFTMSCNKARALICLRPYSQRGQVLNNVYLSGFQTASCIVHCPDMLHVLKSRIAYFCNADRYNKDIDYPVVLTDTRDKEVCIDDKKMLERFLLKGIEVTLSLDTRKTLTNNICCGNLRRALISYRSFCKSEQYPHATIARALHMAGPISIYQNKFQKGRSLPYQLLEGVMREDRRFFVDPQSHDLPTIINLFHTSRSAGTRSSYLLQCQILEILRPHVSGLPINTLNRFTQSLGHEDSVFDSAIQHMLSSALIESPDHDEDVRNVTKIACTEVGAYYLDELLTNDRYLYNVVPDIPLRHTAWTQARMHDDRIGTETQMVVESATEFIYRVIKEEDDDLKMLVNRGADIRNVQRMAHIPLVSERIYSAYEVMLETLKMSHNAHIVKCAAEIIRKHRSNLVEKLKALQDRHAKANEVVHDVSVTRKEYEDLGYDLTCELEYPETVESKYMEPLRVQLKNLRQLQGKTVYVFLSLDDKTLDVDGDVYRRMKASKAKDEVAKAEWLIKSSGKGPCVTQGSVVLVCDGDAFGEVCFGSDV